MKRIIFILALFFLLSGCSETLSSNGNIYGVVTEFSTAEPVRAAGVSLFINSTGSLLLKTVTYDDGHFEFNNLEPNEYVLEVDTDGYEKIFLSVTVKSGRTARADMQIKPIDTGLSVKTSEPVVNGIVTFEGKCKCNAGKEPSEYGFVYGTEPNPRKDQNTAIKSQGASYEDFSAEVKDLGKGSYHVRAYAINKTGTSYGEDVTFEMYGYPGVSTLPVNNIGEHTATLNGRVEYKGDPSYTEKGFVYSASFTNPTLDDPQTATQKVMVKGNNDNFSANIDGLTTNLTYYVRAYIANSNETTYGKVLVFVPSKDVPYIIIDNLAVQKTDSSVGSYREAAIQVCKDSRVGGYSDWRLPTVSELAVLYTNSDKIGGFDHSQYWSSSKSGSYAWCFQFGGGFTVLEMGDGNKRVRCVRNL